MKKKVIRLTESDLHGIVKESVKRVLREADNYDIHRDIQRLNKNYDDNLDDYREEEGYYQDDYEDYPGNWQDMSHYAPNTPEAASYYDYAERVSPIADDEKRYQNERSWKEFDDRLSNKREMGDRRYKYRWDMLNNPDRIRTSSTRNGEDLNGTASMAHLGGGDKWGKRLYKNKSIRDTILSKKAPKQDY